MSWLAYLSKKGAVLAFIRAISLELAKNNIRVNAVLPDAVNTKMLREGLKRNIMNGKNLDNTLKKFEEKHLLGRIGKPKEIAKAIYFLIAWGPIPRSSAARSFIVDVKGQKKKREYSNRS